MKSIPDVDIYVRFCESDAGGHASNTSYFFYFEEARSKFFASMNYGLNDLKGQTSFILARTECDFIQQAFPGNMITVKTYLTHIGTKSFTLDHEIYNKEMNTLLAKGRAVIVCFDFKEQSSIKISDELRVTLEQHLQANSPQKV
ncbi:acyl-CoA thioesterase [Lysinibacillus sp. LZ02]|uniref:acyl-CoA thioesterase n=1 Tax=Lysinibacillus sp. LZ02 TaxID=3420668 RepID=UPI003D36761E